MAIMALSPQPTLYVVYKGMEGGVSEGTTMAMATIVRLRLDHNYFN